MSVRDGAGTCGAECWVSVRDGGRIEPVDAECWVSVRDGGRIEPVDAECWVSVRDGGPH